MEPPRVAHTVVCIGRTVSSRMEVGIWIWLPSRAVIRTRRTNPTDRATGTRNPPMRSDLELLRR